MPLIVVAIVAGAIGLGLTIILKAISGLAESLRLMPLTIRVLSQQQPTRLRHPSCRGDLP